MKSFWKENEKVNPEKLYGLTYTVYMISKCGVDCAEFRNTLKAYLMELVNTKGLVPPETQMPITDPLQTYEGRIGWFCGGGLLHKIRCGKYDKKVALRICQILDDIFSKPKKEEIDKKTTNLIFAWLQELQ